MSDSATVVNEPARVGDGRTRRRRRNIDAVLDAVLELAADGDLDPTSEAIAAIAGISHRSIYRYFDTRAELVDAAVQRAFEAIAPRLDPGDLSDVSFEERTRRFVDARLDVYRSLRPIVHVAELHASTRSVASGIESVRSALRIQLVVCFENELGRLPADDRDLVVALIDAVSQVGTLEYLDESAGFDDEALRAALGLTVRAHLG